MPALNTSPSHRFTRTLNFALFGASLLWVFAAQIIAAAAARGLVNWLGLVDEHLLISSLIFLFLLGLGFVILQAVTGRSRSLGEVLGLPRRATAREEWSVGAALGWGTMVFAVLPIAIFGSLRIRFFTTPHSFLLLFLNIGTFLAAALAEEIAFRGYTFRRLIDATGPITATLITAVLFGLVHMLNPNATWIGVLITMLAGVMFCVTWFRTHGLWLAWGLHFAWNASMGLLFGLPVSGLTDFSAVVVTRAIGPAWLTGGSYGPEAAFFTIIAVLLCIGVLLFVTRDYAWHYTYPPIIPAGYPVEAAPPVAHAAMEQAIPPAGASLVQILTTTPDTMSVQHPAIQPNGSGPQPVEVPPAEPLDPPS